MIRLIRLLLICCCIVCAVMFDLRSRDRIDLGISPDNGSFKVFGRLARTEERSVFSEGGLLGFCYVFPFDLANRPYFSGPHNNARQIHAYRDGICPLFNPYRSHPGAQVLLLYVVQQIDASPETLRLVPAFLFGLILTAWLE